jgi:hypothetical protein
VRHDAVLRGVGLVHALVELGILHRHRPDRDLLVLDLECGLRIALEVGAPAGVARADEGLVVEHDDPDLHLARLAVLAVHHREDLLLVLVVGPRRARRTRGRDGERGRDQESRECDAHRTSRKR